MKSLSLGRLGVLGALGAHLLVTLLFALYAQSHIVRRDREIALSSMSSTLGTARSRVADFFGGVVENVVMTPALAQGEIAFASQSLFVERYFAEVLRTRPSVRALYYGTVDGDFVFVQRATDRGRNVPFDVRSVIGMPERAAQVLLRRGDFSLVRQAQLRLTHPFDPRRQPWFEQAVGAERAYWTEPYLLDPRGLPALTTATRVVGGPDRPDGVVGADILLEPLQELIEALSVDSGGYPFLLAPQDRALSHPALRRAEKPAPVLSPLDALGDPVLTNAVGRLRESGEGWEEPLDVRTADGTHYYVMAGRLQDLDDWTVGAVLEAPGWLASLGALSSLVILQGLAFLLLWLLAGLLLWRWLRRRFGSLRGTAQAFVADAGPAGAAAAARFRPADLDQAERAVGEALQELDRQRHENARLLEEVRRSDRAKTLFLASMSHDLRTPLNAIGGFAEIIARELLGPVGVARYREYAQLILRSNRHMLDLVDNLLTNSALESGMLELRPAPVELDSLAVDVAEEQRLEAEHQGLRLEVEADSGIRAAVDAPKLRVLLANLLRNAIAYTPAGGSIRVRAALSERGEAQLSVADSGVGIEPSRLEQLRRPFARDLEDSYVAGKAGSGLGLSIVDRIAELHGARLAFDTAPGAGTTVVLTLPRGCVVGGAGRRQ